MPKVYKDINVYDAALERYRTVLREFDNFYVSVSGGKDSSVMLQLMAQEARKEGKKFSVLYIDLEAQYSATIRHVEVLVDATKDAVDEWYWVAMPISLRNAVSAISPKWTCWDFKDRDRWVRPWPTERDDVVLCMDGSCPDGWDWFSRGMEFEEFIILFAEWFNRTRGGRTAAGIGIRSDESLNRFRTITSARKERYGDYAWTTRVRRGNRRLDCWNFYPLYDWRAEDDWTAISRYGLLYNEIYELMYKNGVKLCDQRLCQPYGDDQRKGLDQYRSLEPDTWERVLRRVEGVNFGNIYCKTSLLGNISSEKPDRMSWQEYAVFLLESLGLYAPDVMDRYHDKIKKFLARWEAEGGGADDELCWRRIARTVERNEYWMAGLSAGGARDDARRVSELKSKYSAMVRPGGRR